MVLQRPQIVRFLVEQPLLERPEIALALLRVERARLLHEQIVEDRILVAAEVAVGDPDGLELVDVHVGLDDEAALEVHGDVEVAPLQHRVIGGRLDRLLTHAEADLAPLIDEPDAERLIGLRDPAVLEDERKPLGDAGLTQQAASLRPAGLDVAPIAGELFELLRRRRPRRARHLDAGDILHHRDA